MGWLSTVVVIGCGADSILKQAAERLKSAFEKAGFVNDDGCNRPEIGPLLGDVAKSCD
ncbi:hypothetical protein [Vreelandella aquamarina]|jgi:hypothetical protein|uniref:hypothetical protein n=1 Tax=Vreelandella aquamarina TaxID=77097 RepID=UPI00155570C0|nr:hypothetical protein [Halomonas meridiana]MCO7243860.1 hypothetical protein [Halomonas sp. Ps84H-12]|tara:strand:- start:707 stop:880 length:174 start_codon:yes stop_codon:yes gene_type:complete